MCHRLWQGDCTCKQVVNRLKIPQGLSFSWSGLLCLRSSRSKYNISAIDDLPKSRRLHSVSACGCSAEQARFIGDTVKPRERWPEKQKRHHKCRLSTVCWVHAALIVGSPGFVKASVLCHLLNQRERLKDAFVGAKPAAGRPHSQYSVKQNYIFLYYSKRSQFRTRKERLSPVSYTHLTLPTMSPV